VSPILTRPVREQFEHDRIIRLLQARYRRKFEVAINPGAEQNASVAIGEQTVFPDLVLYSQERGRRLEGTVEVETGESVNSLEAMSQWALFSRLRVPFSLYVPPNALDTARRLCTEHEIPVSEIWTYHTALDQVRFTMVHRSEAPVGPKPKPTPAPEEPAPPKAAPAPKPAKAKAKAKAVPKTAGKAAKSAKSAKSAKPAAKPAARPVARKAAKSAPKVAAARKTARPARRR
jgi:hypothetical protein